jgi:branched-chain amino acid aminotransferase
MLDLSALRLPGPLGALPSGKLGFGRVLAPYALVADHDPDHGWHQPRFMRREEATTLAGSASVQYALSVFEGLKALRAPDGSVHLFRPELHARRFIKSAERITLPALPEEDFLATARATVRAHESWVPAHGVGSLYLRPTIYATEEFLGVRPALTHRLVVIASAADAFYDHALRLWAETHYIRAAPGGLGEAKTGANYAASLLGAEAAKKKGYDQVLWLDAHKHELLGEAGTMNVFVVIDGVVKTPALDGTILPGVTRDSCLSLLRKKGFTCEETDIPLREVIEAGRAGKLGEAFGTGTAAIIAPISAIGTESGILEIPAPGPIARMLKSEIEAIQQGKAEDPMGFRVAV